MGWISSIADWIVGSIVLYLVLLPHIAFVCMLTAHSPARAYDLFCPSRPIVVAVCFRVGWKYSEKTWSFRLPHDPFKMLIQTAPGWGWLTTMAERFERSAKNSLHPSPNCCLRDSNSGMMIPFKNTDEQTSVFWKRKNGKQFINSIKVFV